MEAPLLHNNEVFGEKAQTLPSLSAKVAKFNNIANNHVTKQAINPFSNDRNALDQAKRRFSKEEYGRPAKGSKSETRGLKAHIAVLREILQLCEVINKNAEPLYTPDERKDDTRKVISFGELFSLYTTISNKVVGVLLRTRKHKLIDFEGEMLFQTRDDHVPIILIKPIEEIRQTINDKISETEVLLRENQQEGLLDHPEYR